MRYLGLVITSLSFAFCVSSVESMFSPGKERSLEDIASFRKSHSQSFISFVDSGGVDPDEITAASWDDRKSEDTLDIVFFRHVKTNVNVSGATHSQSSSEQVLDLEECEVLGFIGSTYNIDMTVSADSERSFVSSFLIYMHSGSQGKRLRPHVSECFNEQNLGRIAGMSEKDLLGSPDFKKMIKDPKYAPPEGESGEAVMERIRQGIAGIANTMLGKFNRKHGLVFVCTSRLTLNWLVRFLKNDLMHPPVTFNNLDMLFCRFHLDTKKVMLFDEEPTPLRALLYPGGSPELRQMLAPYRKLRQVIDLASSLYKKGKERPSECTRLF